MAIDIGRTPAEIVEKTLENYENYVNPTLGRLFRYMGVNVVEWEAHGAVIRDPAGNEFIDFVGGFGSINMGHTHPRIVKAVKAQMDRMCLSSKVFPNEPMGELARLLAEITPGDLRYSFFCNSGTEAVEAALKLARWTMKKPGIIATKGGFHGKTLGSLSATGRELFRAPFAPLVPGFKHVPYGDAQAIREAIDGDTAAVIVEPIQGEGGVVVPPEGYLREVRQICDEAGILMIVDEVQTGMGRTGRMFAVEHEGVVPDLLCLAKSLGGGVIPIGAVVGRPGVWKGLIEGPYIHTSTFGGSPLACAAGIAAITVLREENLPARAERLGRILIDGLREIQAEYPEIIATVRGKGLLIGMEMAAEGIGGMMLMHVIDRKLLVIHSLNNEKVIRIEPPLVVTEEQIRKGLAIIEEAAKATREMLAAASA